MTMTSPAGDPLLTMGDLVALIPEDGDTIQIGGFTVERVGTFSYGNETPVVGSGETGRNAE